MSDEEWQYLMQDPKIYNMLFGIYQAFFTSPYIGRAWVLQELVLPPCSRIIICLHNRQQCYCSAISLVAFSNIFRLLREDHASDLHYEQDYLRRLSYISFLWSELHGMTSLIESNISYRPSLEAVKIDYLLDFFTPLAKTSEDLDRLYAFYGMNMEPSVNLVPAYGISFTDALISFTRSVLEGRKRLDIFEIISRYETFKGEDDDTSTDELPSWVPELGHSRISNTFHVGEVQIARPDSIWYPWRGPCDSSTLTVCGKILDSLGEEIAVPRREAEFLEDLYDTLLSSERAWETNHDRCPLQTTRGKRDINSYHRHPKPSLFDVVWTLLPEQTGQSLKDTDICKLGTFVNHVRHMSQSGQPSAKTIEKGFEFQLTKKRIWEEMSHAMAGRELWMTQSGRFAICNMFNNKQGSVEAGDVICILHGYDHPLVLRPRTDGRYALVGLCWMDEWMYAFSTGKVFWKEDEGDEFVIV
jgi:hypothetical protein